MKKILLLIFLITSINSFAQVKIIAPIVTNAPTDTYPTHIDSLGYGGFMAVWDIPSRDAIPSDRRKIGMVVNVQEDTTSYQLVGGITNGDWVEYATGITWPDTVSTVATKWDVIKNSIFWNVTNYGAIPNDGTDDWQAFRTADSLRRIFGGVVYSPTGEYTISKELNLPKLIGEGSGKTILNAAAYPRANFPDSAVIFATGTKTYLTTLGANAAILDTLFVLNTSTPLSQGENLILLDTTISSYSSVRAYYLQGEFINPAIASVGTNVVIGKPLVGTYNAPTSTLLYRISLEPIELTGFTVIAPSDMNMQDIQIVRGQGYIQDISLLGGLRTSLRLQECNGVDLNKITNGDYPPDVSGTGYGIAVINSENVHISASNIYGYRHAITHGGDFGVNASIPNRYCSVMTSTLSSRKNYSLDAHGNCEEMNFSHNTILGGLSFGGNSNKFIGNTIYNLRGSQAIHAAELTSISHLVQDNIIYVTDTVISSGLAPIIDLLYDNSLKAYYNQDFVFSNNKCYVTRSAAAIAARFQNNGYTGGVNTVRISDNIFKTSNNSSLVTFSARGVIGATVSDLTIAGNVFTNVAPQILYADRMEFTGNTVDTTYSYGSYFQYVTNAYVKDNIFRNYSWTLPTTSALRTSFYCVDLTNLTINNNTGFTASANADYKYGLSNITNLVAGSQGYVGTLPIFKSGVTTTTPFTHDNIRIDFATNATGDIIARSSTGPMTRIADIAVGNALISGGAGLLPSYGKIGLTTHVSGTLPVANGGTALTSLGTANQQLRVNAGATALEYFTPSSQNIAIAPLTATGSYTHNWKGYTSTLDSLGGFVLWDRNSDGTGKTMNFNFNDFGNYVGLTGTSTKTGFIGLDNTGLRLDPTMEVQNGSRNHHVYVRDGWVDIAVNNGSFASLLLVDTLAIRANTDTFITSGLDNYKSNINGSMTMLSKTSKRYVDSLYSNGIIPTLQQVTMAGNTTSNKIISTYTNPTTIADAAFELNRTVTNAGSIDLNTRGWRDNTVFRRSKTSRVDYVDIINTKYAYVSYDARSKLSGRYFDHIVGFQARPVASGTDTTNYLIGFKDLSFVDSGTVVNKIGINLSSYLGYPSTAVINEYGVYIEPQRYAGNIFGVYVADTGGGENKTAYYSQVNAGANRFHLNMPGTAQSLLGGSLTAFSTYNLDGINGTMRDINIRTGAAGSGSGRWTVRATSTSESGSNVGSDFALIRRSDAGSSLGTSLTIFRATGYALLENRLGVGVSPSYPLHVSGDVGITGKIAFYGGNVMSDGQVLFGKTSTGTLEKATPLVSNGITYTAGSGTGTWGIGTITGATWNGNVIGITYGGTGLSTLGTANQQLRVNSGATGYESFTPQITASATLDFLNTLSGLSSELTISVTGALDGDVVALGVPNVSSNENSCYTARVSATNVVSVKFNNYSALPIDPASGVFKVTVFKY